VGFKELGVPGMEGTGQETAWLAGQFLDAGKLSYFTSDGIVDEQAVSRGIKFCYVNSRCMYTKIASSHCSSTGDFMYASAHSPSYFSTQVAQIHQPPYTFIPKTSYRRKP
jgi:hypothetical protein